MEWRLGRALPPPQCSHRHEWGSGKWVTGYAGEKLRNQGKDPHCCLKGASLSIDGRPYCRTHAGALLIEIHLGQK